MPQQQDVAKHIRPASFMDIIIGTQPQCLNTGLEQVLKERQQVLEVWEERAEKELDLPPATQTIRPLSISTGAAQFSAYRIVPYVGAGRRVSLATIIEIEAPSGCILWKSPSWPECQ